MRRYDSDQYTDADKIMSNASCTTNGLAPFAKAGGGASPTQL